MQDNKISSTESAKDRAPRRDFLAASAAASSFMIVAPQSVRGSQANSALTVGTIGYGNRGSYDTGIFAKNEFAKVTAVCDIFEDKLAAARAKFSGIREYKDIRELLASDVDAVLIATPIIYHPEHFELAVKAKKHIYMEKAAAIDAKGCLRVLKTARSADPTKRISMGFQQRYGTDYRRAHALVMSGELGKIKMVAISSLVGSLVNLPLSWYLTRRLGVSGVIWGTVLTTLVSNLLIPGFYLFRALEISPRAFLARTLSAPMAGALAMTFPRRSRPSTEARSKRKPSTCMSVTQ